MEVNTGETIGLKRKLDDLGRVVIPKEFRDDLGIHEGDAVEIFETRNGIFVKRVVK